MDKETKICSLCIAVQDKKVLLAMKKEGFGQGYWNGVGGKLDEIKGDKNVEDCAVREISEEIGIVATKVSKRGILNFTFPLNDTPNYEVHVFHIDEFQGEPVESREVRPEWFNIDSIPFESMWPNDQIWVPVFLEGKRFKGNFSLGEGNAVLEHMLDVVSELENNTK